MASARLQHRSSYRLRPSGGCSEGFETEISRLECIGFSILTDFPQILSHGIMTSFMRMGFYVIGLSL
ncbi:hypothetical protein F4781DRAFT_404444 [Annulohypoxylon bovei var. microspora]|nr:hypothetical protein F4781DRAFT_404444 [Annulohypoxylon bovei var. microspora]